ncbi:bactofilin [Geobacillus sp. A8]|uniref:polymer-forming cytoskeletal protein n=1 Tax=Geobacillus TaxID=129337 RepID=UPI00064A3F3E|nr:MULTISPECIES: polymer-forming cytoskeletal protein [Geobacillus]ASS99189.1 bactofilin [Geobacillus thermocatenulatus]KLR73355.1 bactofilin [Geobacillus sp. T6]RAN23095.1 bactofilin [Geobacillus sp. A8]
MAERNLTIHGSALSGGGVFHYVTIRGDAMIRGDIECDRLKVFGAADMKGAVAARTFRLFGQANVDGPVQAEKMGVFGEVDIRGHARLGHLQLRGMAQVEGGLEADAIRGYGELSVSGSCEAESVALTGVVHIGQTLNAEQVELSLCFADSSVKEIGGRTIRIKQGKTWKAVHWLTRLSPLTAVLVADTIEGDDIYLEHTKAAVVRGDRVTIGPGCEIGLVEYRMAFAQDEQAAVKEKRQR